MREPRPLTTAEPYHPLLSRWLGLPILAACFWLSACAAIKPVPLTPFHDGQHWVVERPIVYQVGDTNVRVTVPEGFVTDFASIPGFAQSIYAKTGAYQFPAVVHDYLYWEGTTTRKEADKLLLQAMNESEVSRTDMNVIYRAVRVGGGSAWEANRKERERGLPRIVPSRFRDIPAKTTWEQYRRFLYEQGVRP